jgi:pimeloyl-ACP methyl ester carboxylesterase
MRTDVTPKYAGACRLLAAMIALLLSALSAAGPAAAETVILDEASPQLGARIARGDDWPRGDVVLLLHGTLSHRDTEIIESLEVLLQEAGASTVAVNLSLGLDNREGPFDCAAPQLHRERDAEVELARWVAWLQAQGVEGLTLMGHSRGANQLARYQLAAASPIVQRLILIAPPRYTPEAAAAAYADRYGVDLASVLAGAQAQVDAGKGGDPMPVPVGFLYCGETLVSAGSFLSYYAPDPLRDTPALLRQLSLPVLVITGSEDEIATGLPQALADSGDNVSVREIEGADHFFRDLYAYDLMDEALDFMDATRQ